MEEITPNELVTRTHDHLNRYITLADNKASILLTAQIAFLGLFANAFRMLPGVDDLVLFLAVISGGFGVVAVFLSGWVVYPRTPKPQTGLIFWENIVEFESSDEFSEEVEKLDANGAKKYLIRQNYYLAVVAEGKYRWLRWSLRVTAGMVVFAAVAGGLQIFW